MDRPKDMVLYTIGFTKRTAESFFTTLGNNQVRRVIDVRLNNKSQLAGFTKQKDLPYFLRVILGIEYEHNPELAPTKEMLQRYRKRPRNWRENEEAFKKRNWRDYEEAFKKLIAEREIEKTLDPTRMNRACLLCSESSAKYCHRRLVAEYLRDKWGGIEIVHLDVPGAGPGGTPRECNENRAP